MAPQDDAVPQPDPVESWREPHRPPWPRCGSHGRTHYCPDVIERRRRLQRELDRLIGDADRDRRPGEDHDQRAGRLAAEREQAELATAWWS